MQKIIAVNEMMRNGATCLAVHRNGSEGVVLAQTDGHSKYATWVFNTEDEGGTYSGNYFSSVYDATDDYLRRVAKTFGIHTN